MAWSDWSWAADPLLVWSLDSLAAAESTLACALVTWLWRAAESSVASTAPWATGWPAFTLTAVTWPDVEKLRFSVSAGASVPVVDTVWLMLPAVTATTRCTEPLWADDEDDECTSQ